MITLKIVTAASSNASQIGERYAYEGVRWRNSVDRCDSDGCGRVFLDCKDVETAEYIINQMEDDNEVVEVSET